LYKRESLRVESDGYWGENNDRKGLTASQMRRVVSPSSRASKGQQFHSSTARAKQSGPQESGYLPLGSHFCLVDVGVNPTKGEADKVYSGHQRYPKGGKRREKNIREATSHGGFWGGGTQSYGKLESGRGGNSAFTM